MSLKYLLQLEMLQQVIGTTKIAEGMGMIVILIKFISLSLV